MNDYSSGQKTMREIVGEKLSAINFGVFGHLGLEFDGPSFIARNPVLLKMGEHTFRFGESGFCDALCSRLGVVITDVQFTDEEELRIIFADKSWFAMSLRAADYSGPEAGMYYSTDKRMIAFQMNQTQGKSNTSPKLI